MAVPLNNLLNETKTALKTENSNVDITLSALKDAITKTGETVKTLADVVNALSNVTIGSALPEGTNVVGAVVNKNTDGDEIFTESNPGVMQLSGSNVTEDGSVKTTMTTALDSDYDSVNVDKMEKGGVVVAHNAITETTTSAEIDCRGYNAVLIEASVSAEFNWTFKLQGCMVSNGTFVDWYEQANTGAMVAMSYQTNTSKGFIFKGIPDYIKIVATEDADGATVTVKVQPLNV